MTQAIIAGLIGLLAGFGIGNWNDDESIEYGYRNRVDMQEKMEEMMGGDTTPLAEDYVSMRPGVMSLASETLSTEEQNGLVFMREEEKLARDVYLKLYEKWGIPIFNNIAQSEQTHTEAVKDLLDKYNLTDPVADDTVGVFANADLADLYDELVALGEQSKEDALRVGATIEDLDIADLEEQLALTDNADIALVYKNLQRGSRNHLRSFVGQLENMGESYAPEYISQSEYDSITGSNRETGNDVQRGWGGNGGRSGGNGMMDGNGGGMMGGQGGGRN